MSQQMRATFFVLMLSLILITGATLSFAELALPEDLLTFYSKEISGLTLSNSSLVLFDRNDRFQFYYSAYNPTNHTQNSTTIIGCATANCPSTEQISFDYLHNDLTAPFVKKAGGIFVSTHDAPLGVFYYNVTLVDEFTGFSESQQFSIEIISTSLWKQFWHNVFHLFG